MKILTEEILKESNPDITSKLIYVESPIVTRNIKSKKKYHQLGMVVNATSDRNKEMILYTDGETFYVRSLPEFKKEFTEKEASTDGDNS